MHPLEKFKYCPKCGSKHFDVNDEKSKKCENCGFVFYLNPGAATAAFILNSRGEMLVTRRKTEPGKGMLDLPGGFADIGETSEECIRREVKEETGLTVTHLQYAFSMPNVYLYSGFEVPTLDSFYRCKVADESALVAGDDAAACEWVALDDIHTEHFGLRSIRHGIRAFLDLRKC